MSGYKTYLMCLIAVIIALAELAGWDVVPNIDQTNAINAVWAAITAAFLRNGSKADAASVLK